MPGVQIRCQWVFHHFWPVSKCVKPYHSLIVPMTRTAMGSMQYLSPVIARQIKRASSMTNLSAKMVVLEVVLTSLHYHVSTIGWPNAPKKPHLHVLCHVRLRLSKINWGTNVHRIKHGAPKVNECTENFVMNTYRNCSLLPNIVKSPTTPQITLCTKKLAG